MRKEDFYFDLPEELIAQDPLEDRSSSKLLVLDKDTGKVEHHVFRDVLDYLEEGDCLVLNNTKVIPARLFGARVGTEAKIEVLLLKRMENDTWETLVRPGKKAKIGTKISFGDDHIGIDLPYRCEQLVFCSNMPTVIVEAYGIEAVIKCSFDLLGSMYFCHLFSINEKWGFFVFHDYLSFFNTIIAHCL